MGPGDGGLIQKSHKPDKPDATMLTDIEGNNQTLEGLERELDEVIGGNKQSPQKKHRVINDKQYVTLGVLQGT